MDNTIELEIARKRIAEGLRSKSFRVQIGTGAWQLNAQLAGNAKMLCGFAIMPTTITNAGPPATDIPRVIDSTLSLEVNNDVVVDDGAAQQFVVDTSNPRMFFEFPRPLNGQDTITFKGYGNLSPSRSVLITVYYRRVWVNKFV